MILKGMGAEERRLGLGYETLGRLDTLTDPLARTIGFTFDGANRVIEQTLPGTRSIGFSYGPNSNLSTLTPPGRPAHGFEYGTITASWLNRSAPPACAVPGYPIPIDEPFDQAGPHGIRNRDRLVAANAGLRPSSRSPRAFAPQGLEPFLRARMSIREQT